MDDLPAFVKSGSLLQRTPPLRADKFVRVG
jgi:hypothetical protein